MSKVLWVKFGWSDYYRGEQVVGNFSYLAGKGNFGHEMYNFLPAEDGTFFCFVPLANGFTPRSLSPNGWTVICLAKHPERIGIHIVGWYEDATLHGRLLDVPHSREHRPIPGGKKNDRWKYCISSKKAHFVPPEWRTMPFSHRSIGRAKFSYLRGPGVECNANKEEVLKLLRKHLERLRSVAVETPTPDSAPDPVDPMFGFGTPEHRKKVEKAAEKAVKKHFRAKGFLCNDVTKENRGFDFVFKRGQTELHVEVKGTSRKLRRFFLTPNENAYREDRGNRKNPAWRIAIVTKALGPRPKVHVYSSQAFQRKFELSPLLYIAKPITNLP